MADLSTEQVSIREFPLELNRVETGAIQFGDDWPGVFIRGDNAFGYAMSLLEVLRHGNPGSYINGLKIKALLKLMLCCNINDELRREILSAIPDARQSQAKEEHGTS